MERPGRPPTSSPGLNWNAKVTLTGPNNGRGVSRMKVGFIQNATITELNAVYDGQINDVQNKLKSSIQGNTVLGRRSARRTETPWYSTQARAMFFNATPTNNGNSRPSPSSTSPQ